jgi:hypothetical protein
VVAVVLALIAGAAAAVLIANRRHAAPAPISAPKPVVTTTTAAPPPTTTTVTVTATPQIVEKTETHAAPVPTPQPPPQPAPTNDQRSTANEAKEHLSIAQTALIDHRFVIAREEYKRALEHSDQLDERENLLARVGMAVLARDRNEAQRMAMEIHERWPDDPDLRRIVATFPGIFFGGRFKDERPPKRFRRG